MILQLRDDLQGLSTIVQSVTDRLNYHLFKAGFAIFFVAESIDHLQVF